MLAGWWSSPVTVAAGKVPDLFRQKNATNIAIDARTHTHALILIFKTYSCRQNQTDRIDRQTDNTSIRIVGMARLCQVFSYGNVPFSWPPTQSPGANVILDPPKG